MAARGIQSDPDVMMGKPVVEGTRITVESILDELGAGRTIEQLLEAHPRLTREGVLAAVRSSAVRVTSSSPATVFARAAVVRRTQCLSVVAGSPWPSHSWACLTP